MPEYGSYSGTDIVSVLKFPGFLKKDPMVFGQVKTVSYSTYRDKFPVKALGFSNAKGYTKGSRTIAGTLIFTVFDKPVINQFIDDLYKHSYNMVPDELPPFDIHINMSNAYGNSSVITLYDVEIVEGNQILSIDNIETNEQYSFVAQDLNQINREGEYA